MTCYIKMCFSYFLFGCYKENPLRNCVLACWEWIILTLADFSKWIDLWHILNSFLIFGLGGEGVKYFQVKKLRFRRSDKSMQLKSKLCCKPFLILSSLKSTNLWVESTSSLSHVSWVHTSGFLYDLSGTTERPIVMLSFAC